jgi:uncharacterized protein (DUF885 family)
MSIDRRSLLKSGAATAAVTALPAWAATPDAKAVLDDITEQFLRFSPESATSLGIDTGARAGMRARLGDRSPAGQAKLAAFLRQSIKRLDALGAARGLDGESYGRALRPRSKGSPSRSAMSRSAGGATRPMSSSRTSVPSSTCRASLTANTASRTRPMPKPICHGYRATRASWTARLRG